MNFSYIYLYRYSFISHCHSIVRLSQSSFFKRLILIAKCVYIKWHKSRTKRNKLLTISVQLLVSFSASVCLFFFVFTHSIRFTKYICVCLSVYNKMFYTHKAFFNILVFVLFVFLNVVIHIYILFY